MKSIESKDKKFCECGCGEEIVAGLTTQRTIRRFKRGHNGRGNVYPNSIHKGAEQWKWKGGRYIASNGYVMILNPTHRSANCRGYIYEHRVIMEQYLGRPLEEWEDVHHLNGDTQDNRIENLQLLTHREHSRLTCNQRWQ